MFLQNQGFTIKEISEELNIAVATVYGSLKQYGNEMI
ncbi:MAG: terminase gpP N-terminus-related DNA-binding protein [Oscillospiraceae bacterium]